MALDRYLLGIAREAGRERTATLRVFTTPGEIVSLGRYHRVAPRTERSPQGLHRRLSGGRAAPVGEGFVGISLVLPHRSALESDDPHALQPAQVLNRCVRGILQAIRSVNVGPIYPGRDAITIDRRAVAMVCFEVDRHGCLLFEAVLAHRSDFGVLPKRLDRADPGGSIGADFVDSDQATTLNRASGLDLRFEETVELLRRGYEVATRIPCAEKTMAHGDEEAIAAAARAGVSDDEWLHSRVVDPLLDHHGSERTQLGVLEAHFSLGPSGYLDRVVLAGDFLANSPAIDLLERRLRGCPLEVHAIEAVVEEAFADDENFILGIGRPRTIATTILEARRL